MLRITAEKRRLCDGVRRRDVLRVGTVSLLGLSLPELLQAQTQGRVRAKSVILFVLEGGAGAPRPLGHEARRPARGSE